MRHFLPLAIAFTLGASASALKSEREIADLRVQAECNYHEGYNEGYRDRSKEPINGLTIRHLPDGASEIVPSRIEETDPEWDCTRMGNRECGPTATPPDTKGDTTHRVKSAL